ncbi:thiamine pyrophosphokinase [Arthrospiribacter ruber]|uniref:Thiamine pyrophosphokinase n=1 Tax=Arthrospiribacter ruber TaxID=2487934 RepID=A0A951MDR8_9BACT|nr:thiamine pyrophosphokinase [Arthrospiribacter ruber]MBW3467436.1 thiamine pyrophosphokinase [Arthrospiribacter ruber]
MSSHHFVKEQQEPALLILGTEGISYDQIAPLLEWVPTVIVVQEEVYRVISWGIKIDLILADLNFQKSNIRLLEEQYPVKFLGVRDGQFLEEAFQYLIATKHTAVNIVGFDHKNVFALEEKLSFLDITVIDGAMRYFPVKSGKIKKWFPETSVHIHAPEGTLISFGTQEGNSILQVVYATMVDVPEGLATLEGKGVFWVGEILDKK